LRLPRPYARRAHSSGTDLLPPSSVILVLPIKSPSFRRLTSISSLTTPPSLGVYRCRPSSLALPLPILRWLRPSGRAGAVSTYYEETRMKKVEAIIKLLKLEAVKEALAGAGIDEFTVSEVKGCGHQAELYRGSRHVVEFLRKLKVETLVDNYKA